VVAVTWSPVGAVGGFVSVPPGGGGGGGDAGGGDGGGGGAGGAEHGDVAAVSDAFPDRFWAASTASTANVYVRLQPSDMTVADVPATVPTRDEPT
jgi:hypothetical protein